MIAKLPDPGMAFGLVLAGTEVTDAGMKELAGLKSLQTLDLSETQVTDKVLEVLRANGLLHALNHAADDNTIERVWKDLHANVTRNHTCATMPELMAEVRYYLHKRNRGALLTDATAAAA